ncbi:Methionyl-tRNA formyltransferase [Diplonema papillatum]|nr:Methionyl-tRNA formyltransferase [Diplonema papillatum]
MRRARPLLRHSVLFLGSGGISNVCLQPLIADYQGCQRVCRDLRVVGPRASPAGEAGVVQLAAAHGVAHESVPHPKSLRTWDIEDGRWDVGVVVSFRYFLPARLIKKFRLGVINVHPSLLPKYRGSSPLQAALRNNDEEGGVCVIKIEPDDILDGGDIVSEQSIPLQWNTSYRAYHDEASRLGADMVFTVLDQFEARWQAARPQPRKVPRAEDPTFAPLITRNDCRLDLALPAQHLYHHHRSVAANGGAWAHFHRPSALAMPSAAALRCTFVSVHHPAEFPAAHAGALAALPGGLPAGTVWFPAKKECRVFYVKAGGGSWLGCSKLHVACERPKNPLDFMSGYRLKPMVPYPGVFS